MIMGSEEGFGLDLLSEGFRDRLGDGLSVRGAGATSYLVENHQASGGGVTQDVGRLHHFHHECRESAGEEICRTYSGKDAIHHTDGCRLDGEETADLRQDHKKSGLARVGTFPGGVRTGQKEKM